MSNSPVNKWTNKLVTLSRRGVKEQNYETIFNIFSCEGTENQNYVEVTFSQNSYRQEYRKQQNWEGRMQRK